MAFGEGCFCSNYLAKRSAMTKTSIALTDLAEKEERCRFRAGEFFPSVSQTPANGTASQEGCTVTPESVGRTPQVDCATPVPTAALALQVIATITAHCGCGTVTASAAQAGAPTLNNWLFGGTFDYYTPPAGMAAEVGGSIYGIVNFNVNCAGEAFTAASAGLYAAAKSVTAANSGYITNLIDAGKWYLAGGITATEFAGLLLSFCGPDELLALLAAVGLSIAGLLLLIKCSAAA